MSKFNYMAEGKLDSNYLLDLLKDYLEKLIAANDTNGIIEDDFKINTKSKRFAKWFKHFTTSIKISLKNKSLRENYNHVLATEYTNHIKDKLQILLDTNVLTAKQMYELKQTLKAINFDIVIPEIEENRNKVIYKSQKSFLSVLNDVKYLKDASIDYILFNSPVDDLKPFLSEKVSTHTVNVEEMQRLINKFVTERNKELVVREFEGFEPQFKAQAEDFYNDNITDSGVGEEMEAFIRTKMLEKLEISLNETTPEEQDVQIASVNNLLKRLKLAKIEQMMQNLIKLKTNLAQAKEVVDQCKDTIKESSITNKSGIFLIMDNLYYGLSKRCETLQQNIKQKLQLVNKQKVFRLLEEIQNTKQDDINTYQEEEFESLARPQKIHDKSNRSITSGLYDDDDEEEIHITEDQGSDDTDDEVVIDEKE